MMTMVEDHPHPAAGTEPHAQQDASTYLRTLIDATSMHLDEILEDLRQAETDRIHNDASEATDDDLELGVNACRAELDTIPGLSPQQTLSHNVNDDDDEEFKALARPYSLFGGRLQTERASGPSVVRPWKRWMGGTNSHDRRPKGRDTILDGTVLPEEVIGDTTPVLGTVNNVGDTPDITIVDMDNSNNVEGQEVIYHHTTDTVVEGKRRTSYQSIYGVYEGWRSDDDDDDDDDSDAMSNLFDLEAHASPHIFSHVPTSEISDVKEQQNSNPSSKEERIPDVAIENSVGQMIDLENPMGGSPERKRVELDDGDNVGGQEIVYNEAEDVNGQRRSPFQANTGSEEWKPFGDDSDNTTKGSDVRASPQSSVLVPTIERTLSDDAKKRSTPIADTGIVSLTDGSESAAERESTDSHQRDAFPLLVLCVAVSLILVIVIVLSVLLSGREVEPAVPVASKLATLAILPSLSPTATPIAEILRTKVPTFQPTMTVFDASSLGVNNEEKESIVAAFPLKTPLPTPAPIPTRLASPMKLPSQGPTKTATFPSAAPIAVRIGPDGHPASDVARGDDTLEDDVPSTGRASLPVVGPGRAKPES
jgi:hypothetical protein